MLQEIEIPRAKLSSKKDSWCWDVFFHLTCHVCQRIVTTTVPIRVLYTPKYVGCKECEMGREIIVTPEIVT